MLPPTRTLLSGAPHKSTLRDMCMGLCSSEEMRGTCLPSEQLISCPEPKQQITLGKSIGPSMLLALQYIFVDDVQMKKA